MQSLSMATIYRLLFPNIMYYLHVTYPTMTRNALRAGVHCSLLANRF